MESPITRSGGIRRFSLPAGRWVILGKAVVFQGPTVYECRLSAGAEFDRARMERIGGDGANETITLTVLHSSSSKFIVSLRCPDDDPSRAYRVADIKITAIQVDSLSNKAL